MCPSQCTPVTLRYAACTTRTTHPQTTDPCVLYDVRNSQVGQAGMPLWMADPWGAGTSILIRLSCAGMRHKCVSSSSCSSDGGSSAQLLPHFANMCMCTTSPSLVNCSLGTIRLSLDDEYASVRSSAVAYQHFEVEFSLRSTVVVEFLIVHTVARRATKVAARLLSPTHSQQAFDFATLDGVGDGDGYAAPPFGTCGS